MDLKNKIVLVTGSSQGIGRAIAEAFAKEKCKVIITYNKSKSEADKTNKACLSLGATSTEVFHLDVADDKSISSLLKSIQSKYKNVDIMVNNAGVLAYKPFSEQTTSEIELQLRTNLEGLIKMTHAFLPIVKDGIINVASQVGKSVITDATVYCATKWGVRGFTQALALEHRNLRILSLNPGLTATNMTDFEGVSPDKVATILMGVIHNQIKVQSGGDIDVFRMV